MKNEESTSKLNYMKQTNYGNLEKYKEGMLKENEKKYMKSCIYDIFLNALQDLFNPSSKEEIFPI